MAVGLVRCALASLLENDDIFIDLDRKTKIRELCETMLKMCTPEFDSLCADLENNIDMMFAQPSRARRSVTIREKLWTKFHQLRIGTLREVWKKFSSSSGLPIDPIIEQKVNAHIFHLYLCQKMAKHSGSCGKSVTESTEPELTKDEANALVYVSGYIPYKLLRKYEKRQKKDQTAEEYVECLGNMAVAGPECSLPDYAREWIDMINRGGLFPVNEPTYQFFTMVERLIRSQVVGLVLPTTVATESVTKESVVSSVVENKDVLFQWSLLSIDITSEEAAAKLLHEIVSLWLTIRGFSVASAWMEELKKDEHEQKKRTKGLRKGLKKIQQDKHEELD